MERPIDGGHGNLFGVAFRNNRCLLRCLLRCTRDNGKKKKKKEKTKAMERSEASTVALALLQSAWFTAKYPLAPFFSSFEDPPLNACKLLHHSHLSISHTSLRTFGYLCTIKFLRYCSLVRLMPISRAPSDPRFLIVAARSRVII